MSQTPSARRREGRNDFCHDLEVAEMNPYKDEYKRQDYADGWEAARLQATDEIEAHTDTYEEAYTRGLIDNLAADPELKDVLRHIAGLTEG